jgi:UDP-N-acetylglucosamine 3-dehydrogenase
MDRLRMAVTGLGWFGEIHCDAISAIPHAKLAALCTRRPQRLQEMGRKYGVGALYADYRELLQNPSRRTIGAWSRTACS